MTSSLLDLRIVADSHRDFLSLIDLCLPPTSLGGPGVEGPEDPSLVGVSALGYPSGQVGPSEISVCSDIQVSPHSIATGIADARTQLEAPTPSASSSLRQPPIAATETAAAQGLTIAQHLTQLTDVHILLCCTSIFFKSK